MKEKRKDDRENVTPEIFLEQPPRKKRSYSKSRSEIVLLDPQITCCNVIQRDMEAD